MTLNILTLTVLFKKISIIYDAKANLNYDYMFGALIYKMEIIFHKSTL
jgi:hypothetical protein